MVLEVIGLAGAIGLALLLWAQRALDARSWPTWERLEGRLARDAAWMRGSFERRTAVIVAFLEAVEGEWREGDADAAQALLEQARAQVNRHAQDTRESLREWGEEARALMALLPVAPVPPGRLRLGRLRGIAIAWRACHSLGVSSRERFLLRLAVLRWSFGSLAGWWNGVPLPRRNALAWHDARTLHADLGTLGTACADSYEALLVSRDARPERERPRRVTRAVN